MKTKYYSLDLAKFVCAILIIILHTSPLSTYSRVLTYGLRNIVSVIAVPFFFVCSAFLFFKKIDSLQTTKEKDTYFLKYIKRLAIMYLIWTIVYLPFVIYEWSLNGFANIGSELLYYIRDFLFEGSYKTIWFIPALISSISITYLLNKVIDKKWIFLISSFLYIFTLLGSSYHGVVEYIPFLKIIYTWYYTAFDTIKNGVLFGFVFVSIGLLISNTEQTKKSHSYLILSILFFVLFAGEEVLLRTLKLNTRGVDTTLFLVPLSYFLFSLILKIDLKAHPIFGWFRTMSILMFLTQRIPLSIIQYFLSETILYTNSLLYFIVVLSSTMIISYTIIVISKKVKWLKYAF